MKRTYRRYLSPLAILALAASLLTFGCIGSKPLPGETPAQTEARVAASIKADAMDLALVGCAYAIAEDPGLKGDFVQASASLKVLASRDRITAGDVVEILRPVLASIKELRGPRGALIVASGKLILNRATGAMTVENNAYVKALAEGIYQGFENAIQ